MTVLKRVLTGGAALGILFATMAAPAMAERNNITIKAPGMQVQQKKGWFGSRSTEYNDALGNNYSHSKGWFGGESRSGGVFGSRISQNRSGIFGTRNTEVTGPNGQVLVQQKRGIFGGKSTTIDAESMWENAKGIFGTNAYQAPPASY